MAAIRAPIRQYLARRQNHPPYDSISPMCFKRADGQEDRSGFKIQYEEAQEVALICPSRRPFGFQLLAAGITVTYDASERTDAFRVRRITMPRTVVAVCVLIVCASVTSSQEQNANDFVSDASRIIGTYQPKSREHTPHAMAISAQAFLDSLDDTLRRRAAIALDHQERRKWTNLPARPGAGGAPPRPRRSASASR